MPVPISSTTRSQTMTSPSISPPIPAPSSRYSASTHGGRRSVHDILGLQPPLQLRLRDLCRLPRLHPQRRHGRWFRTMASRLVSLSIGIITRLAWQCSAHFAATPSEDRRESLESREVHSKTRASSETWTGRYRRPADGMSMHGSPDGSL